MTGLIFKGQGEGVAYCALWAANFFEFFFGYLLAFDISLYLLHMLDDSSQRVLNGWRKVFTGIFSFSVVMLVISQFTGIFYTIDSSGFYQRGPLFWLSQTVSVISLILDITLIIRYRHKISIKERIAFIVYVSLPAVAVVMQMFFYGVYLMLLVSTLSAIIMVIFIVSDQTEQFCMKENELADMRSAVMLSQIQPHFLYNSLSSIAQLCEEEPEKAKKATIAFAEYLRSNMNSLQIKEPVPFEDELEHIKTYLFLEKIRFGDDLEIKFNINTTDFRIPLLSIQPIVENAVKWGLSKKESGGTVTLSTFDYSDRVEIVVEDDGMGFDVDQVLKDERPHIGIENARTRLKKLSHASMYIESEIGLRTKVRIEVPKGENEDENTGS